jgi:hypothetical protein
MNSAPSRTKRILRVSGGALLLLVGLATALWLAPATFMLSRASQSFVETPAVVRWFDLTEQETKGGLRGTAYLTFSYEVDGVTYTSCDWDVSVFPRFARARRFDDWAEAEACAARYSVGSTFQALVDPNDPTRAAVRRGTEDSVLMMLALGAMTAAIGVSLLKMSD